MFEFGISTIPLCSFKHFFKIMFILFPFQIFSFAEIISSEGHYEIQNGNSSNIIGDFEKVNTYEKTIINISLEKELNAYLTVHENSELAFFSYMENGTKLKVIDLYSGEIELNTGFVPENLGIIIRVSRDVIKAEGQNDFIVSSEANNSGYYLVNAKGSPLVKLKKETGEEYYYLSQGFMLQKSQDYSTEPMTNPDPLLFLQDYKNKNQIDVTNSLLSNYQKYTSLLKEFDTVYDSILKQHSDVKTWILSYRKGALTGSIENLKDSMDLLIEKMPELLEGFYKTNWILSWIQKGNELKSYKIRYERFEDAAVDYLVTENKIADLLYLLKIYSVFNGGIVNKI